jgi:hypothetical protein
MWVLGSAEFELCTQKQTAGMIHLARQAILVNLAEAGPLAQLLVVAHVDERDIPPPDITKGPKKHANTQNNKKNQKQLFRYSLTP